MRQGPDYDQYISQNVEGDVLLYPPLELVEELSKFDYVTWIDNRDGTYTLRPYNG